MKHLTGKHYAILAAMLVALGTQLGGLEHGWHDAMTPAFIGGVLMQIGTMLAALFVGAPQTPWTGEDSRRQEWDVTG